MDNSRVLLFVVPDCTSRSVAAMCEAAYHIGRQASSVVLCLQRMTEEAAAAEQGTNILPPDHRCLRGWVAWCKFFL